MVYAIVIYSFISFGFSDSYTSQFNSDIWLTMLLKYELDASINLKVPSHNKAVSVNSSLPGDFTYLNTIIDTIDSDTLLNQDTTLIPSDTTFVDSTAFDSTARVKYFRYRSEEHTSELQSRENLVCRLLLEKKKKKKIQLIKEK